MLQPRVALGTHRGHLRTEELTPVTDLGFGIVILDVRGAQAGIPLA